MAMSAIRGTRALRVKIVHPEKHGLMQDVLPVKVPVRLPDPASEPTLA